MTVVLMLILIAPGAARAEPQEECWAEPKVGVTLPEETILRVGPGTEFDRRYPLSRGVRLLVTGGKGEWYKVQLSGPLYGWITCESLEICPAGTLPSRPMLKGIRCRDTGDGVAASLQLSEPGAFEITEGLDGRSLDVTLHNAAGATEEIIYPIPDEFIEIIQSMQDRPECVTLRFRLSKSLWGYDASFDGNRLVVKMKKPPASIGQVHVILDPGHGGGDSGAVGAAGLKEKDINLEVALRLRDKLQARGLRVSMTRDADTEVAPPEERGKTELLSRVRAAAKAGGNIFISIHHNAMPEVSDGRKAHGSYVYYYRPQSRELARSLVSPVAQAMGEDRAACILRSFFVIRQTAMPSVLVEVQFISNPAIEEKMREKEYSEKAAEGILEGLLRFLEETLPG